MSSPSCGWPKPEYDPARTTPTERRKAKVAELAGLDAHHAKLLGLGSVSYRTLIRWENARRRLSARERRARRQRCPAPFPRRPERVMVPAPGRAQADDRAS
ncbi:hypothetical protein ACWGLF_26355 [Streptomyces puniciscabiei]